MKPVLALTIAAAIAGPAFVAPQIAAAESCYEQQRHEANKGTVIGGVGGAVLGSAVAGHGAKTEGAVLGGVVGAVAGHQIAKNNAKCDNYRPPRQCKWVSEYRHGRKQSYEVCKGRDGVWRRR